MTDLPPVALSIGICTLNRDRILVETLRNVLAGLPPAPAEVLVADQTRDHREDVVRQLQAWHDDGRIEWIKLDTPSLTGARNEVLRRARGGVVVFVDDDVLVPPHFFRQHLAGYADPEIAGVTGQVYHCSDPDRPPPMTNPKRETTAHYLESTRMPTRVLVGCNHSVRRSAALAVAGYDEYFIASAHCEDFDMADRLVAAGRKLLYDPGAWLIHRRAPSGGCRVLDAKPRPEWTNTANLFLYAFRHGPRRRNFWTYVRRALRTGPLRRENVGRPWRWPWAWGHLLHGAWYGFSHRRAISSRLLTR